MPTLLLNTLLALALAAPLFPTSARAQSAPTNAPPPGLSRHLAEFGPIKSPKDALATYDKAVAELGKTGGILVIPAELSSVIKAENTSQTVARIPPLPEDTKRWATTPGIIIVNSDPKHLTVRVPQVEGLHLARTLRLPAGESLPHWGTHPMITLENNLVYGSISYLDWIQAPVQAGKDRRFYLATVRGIRPGEFLNLHGGPGYGGGVVRGYVKAVGYDPEKKLHYFVADTTLNHVAGAIVQNKSNTGLLHMTQDSHNDNQTYDVKIIRRQYAHGDTYGFYMDFDYMSDVHSAAGDENGNCYAAFIRSLSKNNFRGKVAEMDWKDQLLTFSPTSQNINSLGDSRPLINLNPAKHITQGKVFIVPPESFLGTNDSGKYPFGGKTYPTRIQPDPVTKVNGLKMGGLIRGDKDCPWTPEIVGRFFAVTEPGELIPKGNLRRWYEITRFQQNPDGTKDLEIRRFWWGAKSAGSPTLYNRDNYTWDNHLRPLSYEIAPGTYVNNVSQAIPGGDRGGQRKLGVSPYTDQGTPKDFVAGDEIEQAIGPDPFKPQAFRIWMREDVPGAWPSAVMDVANNGEASRHAFLSLRGGPSRLEDLEKRAEKKPAWDNVFVVNTAVTVGLNFEADVAQAAILFQQPNHEQPIKWHYGQQDGKPPREASLTVSKSTGELTFQGEGVRVNGTLTATTGLSATATPARNLRGKNLPVPAGATSLKVDFPAPETDADFALFLEQSWLTARAITTKTPTGFTVTFATPAPASATLDWMIVR